MNGSNHGSFFYFGSEVTILFEGWHVTTTAGLIGSCAIVLIIGFVFEVLKTFRALHLRNAAVNVRHREIAKENEKSQILEKHAEGEIAILSLPHVIQTLLQVLLTGIGYILMLIVMTYNMWLVISVLIGVGLGYFASAWKRHIAVDTQETAKE
ncbi:high affinity copper uptake protein 1-like [Asterias amurensis]|uniref:high affinity copper uptake protein 1-like n=1 Tax=Asterias amurensis TaxID=7602 RepID=UPI003AB167BE